MLRGKMGAVLRVSGDEPHLSISLPVRVCSRLGLHRNRYRTHDTVCDSG